MAPEREALPTGQDEATGDRAEAGERLQCR